MILIHQNKEPWMVYIHFVVVFIHRFVSDSIRFFFRWKRVELLMSSNDATFDYWDRLILDMQLPQGCIVSVDYAYRDSAVSSKRTFYKTKSLISKFSAQTFIGSLLIFYRKQWESELLTAFCPRAVQRVPSEAFAWTARIMYVGSMYFTSIGIFVSLKYFFVYTKIKRKIDCKIMGNHKEARNLTMDKTRVGFSNDPTYHQNESKT